MSDYCGVCVGMVVEGDGWRRPQTKEIRVEKGSEG